MGRSLALLNLKIAVVQFTGKEDGEWKVEAVRCPVHNQRAQAVLKSGPGLNYEGRGCYDALTAGRSEVAGFAPCIGG
jgi:hypothetical protein